MIESLLDDIYDENERRDFMKLAVTLHELKNMNEQRFYEYTDVLSVICKEEQKKLN